MKEIGLKDNPNSVTPFNVFLEGTNFILKIKVYKLIKSHEYIKGHKERREPLTIWPQVHKDITSKCLSLSWQLACQKKLKHSHLKQPKRIKIKFVIFFLCIPSHESTNLMTMAQHLMKIEGTSKGATVGVF